MSKHIANTYLCRNLLPALLDNESVLRKPKRVSSHIAISIAKIISKHTSKDEILQVILHFVNTKLMQNIENPELALLYAGHLKTIILNLSNPQVSMLENADFPVKFVMMSA